MSAEDAPPESPSILPQPPLDVRWVHAGAQHLDLLATPVTAASTTYLAFSAEESEAIDAAWFSRYTEAEREEIRRKYGTSDKDKVKEKEEKRASKDLDSGKKQVYKEADEDGSIGRDAMGRTADEREKANDDILRSGEEQPVEDDEDERIRKEYEENENLELIKGVPVSQVGSIAKDKLTSAGRVV